VINALPLIINPDRIIFKEEEMTIFKIPVISIQSTLMSIQDHPKVVDLKAWLIEKVEKERSNWGITGHGFKIAAYKRAYNKEVKNYA